MAESGEQALSKQIARLNSLGNLAARSVPFVAIAVKGEIAKQIKRGEGPDGRPWRLTEAGETPLKNADQAVQITVSGTVVLLRLDGHHARHHLGAVKGKKQRKILPTGNIPQPMTRAIKRVVTGEFFVIMETTDSR